MLNLYLTSLYSMLVTENPVKQAYQAYVEKTVAIKSGPEHVLSMHAELERLHAQRNYVHRMVDRLPETPRRLDITR
jgi:hypothetical protein